MHSLLNLKHVCLEALEIRAAETVPPRGQATEDYSLRLEPLVEQKEGALDYRVFLGCRLRRKKDAICRYERVEFRLTGYFSLPLNTEESLVNQLIPLNCLAILYGIGRGIVAQATGLVPGGPLLIPPVNLVEEMAKQERRQARLEAKKSIVVK